MSSNFCTECGHRFDSEAPFCPECGHPRTDATAPEPSSAAAPPPPAPPPPAPAPPPAPVAPVGPVAPPPVTSVDASALHRRIVRTRLVLAACVLGALALLVGALALTSGRSDEGASSGSGEVFLVAADDPGPDAFWAEAKVADPTTTAAPTTSAAPTTTRADGAMVVATRPGGTPGLYGGTRDVGRCDPGQMVSFLQANPAKAQAWVAALNADATLRWSGGTSLSVDQIPAYVDELTPVTLVSDTRVTNHGYRDGRPTSIQAVLQRGTAVMVDAYGTPRVKCGCGNPLTAPLPVRRTVSYTGTPWAGWNPASVTVVVQNTVVVQQFVLVNLSGPGYLSRPVGTDGSEDTEAKPPASTTTTSPATTAPTTAPATTAPPATGDFCTIAESWVPEFRNFVLAGLASDQFPDTTKVVAGAEQLRAVAPNEQVASDLDLLLQFLRNPSAQGAQIELAALRAYLLDTCHINVDG